MNKSPMLGIAVSGGKCVDNVSENMHSLAESLIPRGVCAIYGNVFKSIIGVAHLMLAIIIEVLTAVGATDQKEFYDK